MLRWNQPALQVRRDGRWQYVFCYNGDSGRIIVTQDRRKALNADLDLDYFARKFGNDVFRSDKGDVGPAISSARFGSEPYSHEA